ncbi:hypothetical protein STRNTR1_1614 [Stenotrophomonas maltophilia]|nr:hypothetical protein STRNTR1_1614 [Stenotrophomonas maltophilia]
MGLSSQLVQLGVNAFASYLQTTIGIVVWCTKQRHFNPPWLLTRMDIGRMIVQ